MGVTTIAAEGVAGKLLDGKRWILSRAPYFSEPSRIKRFANTKSRATLRRACNHSALLDFGALHMTCGAESTTAYGIMDGVAASEPAQREGRDLLLSLLDTECGRASCWLAMCGLPAVGATFYCSAFSRARSYRSLQHHSNFQ